MPSRPLNSTAGALLGLLHTGPMTGWDLWVAGRDAIGDFWTLTRSQVYRELAAMDTAGLVAAEESGPRDRRPYALTDAGRAGFLSWLDEEPGPEQIRYPLLLKMAFGHHLGPGRLAEFAAAHRQTHADTLGGYLARRDDAGYMLDTYGMATLDFGIRYETAVLDWFDHLPENLRSPR